MSRALRNNATRVTRSLWLIELVLLMVAVTFAAKLRYLADPSVGLFDFMINSPLRSLMVALFITGAMAAFGLYQIYARHQRTELLLRLAFSFAFGGACLFVLFYLIHATYIGRGVLALALALGMLGVLVLRSQSERLLGTNTFKRRVLVFGAGHNAQLINARLRRANDRRSFVVVGFLAAPGEEVAVQPGQVLEFDAPLPELVDRWKVQEIVVALDERRGTAPMGQLLECARINVATTELSAFFEREAGKLQLNVLDPSTLVYSDSFGQGFWQRLGKRSFDVLAASCLLLVAWPFMALVALLVRLESPGPVLYWQTRVGLGGRAFELLKFRSMCVDAEKDGQAKWAQRNDDRTTRVGRFIRKVRLDELPQLYNILRGDMSFVGPRPERPQFVEQLTQHIRFYNLRHTVKPGLAGWAQLRYPYGASIDDAEEKLKFDLYYIKNQGLLLDAMILLQTVEVVVFGRGR